MGEPINVDESLVERLPLPIAKPVRRAQNAETSVSRDERHLVSPLVIVCGMCGCREECQ